MRCLLAYLVVAIAISGCAATHMLDEGVTPKLEPVPNTAKLVIIRDTRLGMAIAVWNYLDRKLIGETKGGTYFVTDVAPGPHYVVASSENTMTLKFDFEAGKKYFLRQDIWMGVWRARAGLSTLNAQEASEAMADCTYWEYDPKNPGEDIDKELFDQAVSDYEQGLKDDPEGYKASLEYKGF